MVRDIPEHVKWLVDTDERITTADGKTVEVWEFCHELDDDILSDWARHFRNHYCLDTEIDNLRHGYGKSRADYLKDIKFPDVRKAPGPSIRAGDFGEILIADYLEYILNFWVPRVRYGNKGISNESTKGCDTIGFIIFNEDEESAEDILAVYETKARLTSDRLTEDGESAGFKSAISDSAKDRVRIAESLNYLKQTLSDKNKLEEAKRVERFQNPGDRPYTERFGAAVIFSKAVYVPDAVSAVCTNEHPDKDNLYLIIIYGDQLMELVHALYERAANEA
jgi:hypothetical protein